MENKEKLRVLATIIDALPYSVVKEICDKEVISFNELADILEEARG